MFVVVPCVGGRFIAWLRIPVLVELARRVLGLVGGTAHIYGERTADWDAE